MIPFRELHTFKKVPHHKTFIYQERSSTKSPTTGIIKFTIFVDPFFVIIYNILSMSDLCFRVEKDILNSDFTFFVPQN